MTDYNFDAFCPFCKGMRGQARTGEPIEVYAIYYDHTWKLTSKKSNKLREDSDLLR